MSWSYMQTFLLILQSLGRTIREISQHLHFVGENPTRCMIDNGCYIMHANKQANIIAGACLLTFVKQTTAWGPFHQLPEVFCQLSPLPHTWGKQLNNMLVLKISQKPSQAFFQPRIPHTPTIQSQAAFRTRQRHGLLTVLPGHVGDKEERVSCGDIVLAR